MQYKFFTVSVFGNDNERTAEEMNSFIRGHRVLNVQREFLNYDESSIKEQLKKMICINEICFDNEKVQNFAFTAQDESLSFDIQMNGKLDKWG